MPYQLLPRIHQLIPHLSSTDRMTLQLSLNIIQKIFHLHVHAASP